MSSKIRKQIYIEPRQEHLLKAIAQQAGVSEAEIIRQAIDLHLGEITGRILLDTNILVFIYDSLDTAKQECAIAVRD